MGETEKGSRSDGGGEGDNIGHGKFRIVLLSEGGDYEVRYTFIGLSAEKVLLLRCGWAVLGRGR